jgi:hypothetical protein
MRPTPSATRAAGCRATDSWALLSQHEPRAVEQTLIIGDVVSLDVFAKKSCANALSPLTSASVASASAIVYGRST